jgi:hypothetical protein
MDKPVVIVTGASRGLGAAVARWLGAMKVNLKKTGALEPPEIPGRSIAWLALHAPAAMSGEFRSYDDPDIMAPAKAMLGGSLPLKFAPEV